MADHLPSPPPYSVEDPHKATDGTGVVTGDIKKRPLTGPTFFQPLSKPKDYRCLACFVTLLCCPIGIFSLLFSCKTREAASKNNVKRASAMSRKARCCGVAAIVMSVLATGGFVVYLAINMTAYCGVTNTSIESDDFRWQINNTLVPFERP